MRRIPAVGEGSWRSQGRTSPPRLLARAIASLPALVLFIIFVALGATATGCGRGGSSEITEIRQRTDEEAPAPEATLTQRFRPDRPMGGGDPHGAVPTMRAPSWSWKTPDGWRELGPAPMRVVAWQVAGDNGAECSFSTLPATGGGLAANVDRWRKQMSLPPAGEAGVAALPRHPMLGRDALRVELSGTFVGMGGDKSAPGSKLLGLVVEMPAFTAFLKMTGPAAVVDAETAHFLALAASIAATVGSTGGGGATEAPTGPDTTLAPFGWSAPPEWVRQPARTMRIATFVPAGAPGTEAYIVVLPGRAGGTRANLDRWRSQMGLSPLTDAEFDALPRSKILGGTAIYLTADGTYSGMAGTEPAPGGAAGSGQRLVGMAIERANDMVFVKMTGPKAEVLREEARLKAFCESFHE